MLILLSQQKPFKVLKYFENTQNGEFFGKIVPLPSCNRTEFPSDVTLNPELTSEQSSNLNSLLEKYSDIVTDVPLKTNVMTCEIRLTTEDPVSHTLYHMLVGKLLSRR